MKSQNLCAISARTSVTLALFVVMTIGVCTSPVLAGSILISNTAVRDTWTNSLPSPITGDLSPDKFMLNSDRAVEITPFLQVLHPDPLTMQTGAGEGLAVANASSSPAGFHDLSSVIFEATFGSGLIVKDSVVGLVTNYSDTGDDALDWGTKPSNRDAYYGFKFGTTGNVTPEDNGFSIVKRLGNGTETILFQDTSVGLERLSVYDFKMARDGVTGAISVSIVNTASGFFGAEPGTGHVISHTVYDDTLGPGAIGIYQENIADGQWDNLLVVPEPNAMALGCMGCLGLLIFCGLRYRRQVAVHTLL